MADSTGVNRLSALRITADGRAYSYSYLQEFSDFFSMEGLKSTRITPLPKTRTL